VDLSRPYSAVAPSLDGDVLVALAGVQRPLTGREVAQLAQRGSPSAVATVLDRLVEHGLVIRKKAGRANLHELNRRHVAFPAVEALATTRATLFDRIGKLVERWALQPVNITLFGSAARGDGGTRSDIDLFVVRPANVAEDDPAWTAQVDALREEVFAWTGNHAAIVETSHLLLRAYVAFEQPVVSSLKRDGIDLAGTNLRSLLRGPERG
jgi:hypothetical protein